MRTFVIRESGEECQSASDAVKAVLSAKQDILAKPDPIKIDLPEPTVRIKNWKVGQVVTIAEVGIPIFEDERWVWNKNKGLAYSH